jgi:hypothetical protein
MHGTAVAARNISGACGRPVDFTTGIIAARKSTLTTQRAHAASQIARSITGRRDFAPAHPRKGPRRMQRTVFLPLPRFYACLVHQIGKRDIGNDPLYTCAIFVVELARMIVQVLQHREGLA